MTSTRDPERLVHSRAAEDAELGQLLRRAATQDPAPAQVEQVIAGVLTQLGPARPSLLLRHGPWLATVGLLLAGGAWLAAPSGAPDQGPREVARSAAHEHAEPAQSTRPPAAPSARLRAVPGAPTESGAAPSRAPTDDERAPPVRDEHAPQRERGDQAPTLAHGEAAPPAVGVPSTPPSVTPSASAPSAPVSAHAEVAPARSSAHAPAPSRVRDRARPRTGSTGGAPDDELALLVRAQRALAPAPLEALTALRAHAAAHPQGRYAEERDALVCDALARLGRSDELHAAAAAFLAVHVGSPLAPRIARYLDGARSAQRQSTHSDSGPATTLIK